LRMKEGGKLWVLKAHRKATHPTCAQRLYYDKCSG
jgi:hypothetical protein